MLAPAGPAALQRLTWSGCHGRPLPLKSFQSCPHSPPKAYSPAGTIFPTGPKNPCYDLAPNATVAQLDRASDYESGGRRFESSRVRKERTKGQRELAFLRWGGSNGTRSRSERSGRRLPAAATATWMGMLRVAQRRQRVRVLFACRSPTLGTRSRVRASRAAPSDSALALP